MSSYLDSSIYLLEMNFYNQGKKSSTAQIVRKKTGVSNPFSIDTPIKNVSISLRQLIEDTIEKTGAKKLNIDDNQYKMLYEVDICYQELEVRGYGHVYHCHWSVADGLSLSKISLDSDYVRNIAVYSWADSIDAEAWCLSQKMWTEKTESMKTDKAKGEWYAMVAADYPEEETRARYDAYWKQARDSWESVYLPYISRCEKTDLKKKKIVVASSINLGIINFHSLWSALRGIFESQGAEHKDGISAKTDILLVDMVQIEKLDHYAERLWRLPEGDEKALSKIGKLTIERAIQFNNNGSNISIVSLQDFLEQYGFDYNAIVDRK